MSDLRERAPATAAMQKLVSYVGTADVRELPLGMMHVSNEALMWLRGVRGELSMAEQLEHLDSREWVVLHSVLVDRYTDIDHIVVGPPGVFPINTKRLMNREVVVDGDVFRSDGWRKKYLAKSEIEARRIDSVLRRAQIAAKVLPIIAISGAAKVKVKAQPHWHGRYIGVAKVEQVVWRLRKRPPRLEADEIRRIADVLADSHSWARASGDQTAPPGLLDAYRRIEKGTDRLRYAVLGVVFAVSVLFMFALSWWVGLTIAPGVAAHIASLFDRG
jgi:hypothetical protein